MAKTNGTDEALGLEEVAGGVLPKAVDDAGFDALAAGERLAKETVVLELHIRKPGFTKPIKPDAFIKRVAELETSGEPLNATQRSRLTELRNDIEASRAQQGGDKRTDPSFLHVSQDVLDRKEIAEIVRHDDRFIEWLRARSAPCPMLANGLYLVPITFVDEIDAAIFRFVKERSRLLDKFEEKYSALQVDAKQRRWPFYEESDYPAFPMIRAKYRVEAGYRSFNVPAALERINREIYERESQKAKLEWADSATVMRDAARLAFKEYTSHLAGQLGRDAKTGKRKMFHEGSVTKLREFIEIFMSGGNLAGDTELQEYVQQARQLLDGIDPAEIKKNTGLRETLETSFNQLKERTASLVTVQQRRFTIEEEPEEPEEPVEEPAPAEVPEVAAELVEDTGFALEID
jgi:hypothetical protein